MSQVHFTPTRLTHPSGTTSPTPKSLGSLVCLTSSCYTRSVISVSANFNAEGQVQPFWLNTSDGERLFCWHVIPLDVYLENEHELSTAPTVGEIAEELKGTVGEKALRWDTESRVVVNFHGVGDAFSLSLSYIPRPFQKNCAPSLCFPLTFPSSLLRTPFTSHCLSVFAIFNARSLLHPFQPHIQEFQHL